VDEYSIGRGGYPMVTIEMARYNTGERKVFSTITFDGDSVRFSPNTPKISLQEWNSFGVIGRKGKRYLPKDGEEFMKALLVQYNASQSSYVNAEPVEEAKREEPKNEKPKTPEEMRKSIVW
jgi:hypothetical protein